MNKYNQITQRLKSDYDMLVEQGHEVVGVFLQGSQNYNLDYEGSDIDTKAILLPSFEDFLLTKTQMISTTIELEPTKEHVDIKDIRLMFGNFKKMNINFLEILFTDYNYINPKYAEVFQPMFDNRELIARYDQKRAINSIAGMAMEKYKAMEHPYPTLVHKILKYGFDGKQVHHIERLKDFMSKYTTGCEYRECLKINPELKDHLIKVKTNEAYDLETARVVAKRTCDELYAIGKEWLNNHQETNIIKTEVDDIMKQVLVDIFRLRFIEELKEGDNQ